MQLHKFRGRIEKFGHTHFFTITSPLGHKTTWNIAGCVNPKASMWHGLVDNYIYEEKYKLMKKYYNGDYEQARNKAINSDEFLVLEQEKQKLLQKSDF